MQQIEAIDTIEVISAFNSNSNDRISEPQSNEARFFALYSILCTKLKLLLL